MMLIHLFLLSMGIASAEQKPVSVSTMTLEEKVGQLFIFGFAGKEITPGLQKTLRTLKPGAVLVFGRNIQSLKQISQLNSNMQKISLQTTSIPLFIAVDQEGGGVARIHTSPDLPNAYTIGNTNEPTLSFQAGKVTGEILRTLGFNMDLAPVLDVTDDKLTSFVGPRSFSESPHKISSMGVAFAQGLAESKIIPVAKHFPGHGPIALDSHHMTPVRQVSSAALFSSDLVPFTQFASSNINSGVMVAHISFPKIDKSELPATYSEKIISKILIDQLKYNGLVMTDDIEMAGASSFKKIEDRAIAAIKAGNDIVMVGWSPRLQIRAVKGVIAAVKEGTIPMERIDHSVKKILRYKSEIVQDVNHRRMASQMGIKESFKKIPYKSVFNDIFSSYFKNLPGLQHVASKVKSVRIVSDSQSFRDSFRSRSHLTQLKFSKKLSPSEKIKEDSLVVFHASSLKTLEALRDFDSAQRKRMIIVSSHPKVHIQDKSSFIDVIAVYSYHPNLGGFTAEAIDRSRPGIAANDSTLND